MIPLLQIKPKPDSITYLSSDKVSVSVFQFPSPFREQATKMMEQMPHFITQLHRFLMTSLHPQDPPFTSLLQYIFPVPCWWYLQIMIPTTITKWHSSTVIAADNLITGVVSERTGDHVSTLWQQQTFNMKNEFSKFWNNHNCSRVLCPDAYFMWNTYSRVIPTVHVTTCIYEETS